MSNNRIPPSSNLVDLANKQGLSQSSHAAREAIRKEMVNVSLNVPNPTKSSIELSLDYNAEGSRIDLPVDDIAFYENNPRQTINPLFEVIKESIRESGILTPLVVTRKSDTKQYFLAVGGNTRLKAIKELWLETQDSRFYKTSCTFVAWKSESNVLAAHLIENEVRGSMTFWDKAQGLWALKAKLDAEQSKPLGLRDFERSLKELGLPTQLSVYAVCVKFNRILTYLKSWQACMV
jgi:ParB family protein of integrating conjugative element (PFGI_1 class)